MQLTAEYTNFINTHEQQLLSSDVPRHFWKTLYEKITKSIFNVGTDFQLLRIEYDEARNSEDPVYVIQVTSEEGIDCKNPVNIYLVDHAWTFQTTNAREHLLTYETLLNRMCDLMGIELTNKEQRINRITELVWKYCQTYSINNAATIEDRLPFWYVMDEVGSAIIHSDEPNFRTIPFLYQPDNITYTIMFPIRNLESGEFVTRDFAEGITDLELRKAYLLPWIKVSFLDTDSQQIEPDEEYFLSGHVKESLPTVTGERSVLSLPLKVYTTYELIKEYLTSDRFVFTEDDDTANILWLTTHFKDFASLTLDKYINQFPFEYVITIKDLLSIICRRKSRDGKNPTWLPVTYNLKTELVKFISYYQQRAAVQEDNHWIIKPWNLARGLDTHITANLDCIIRLASVWPPKIVQKYIENPVLFYRPECGGKVKFDLRYVLLLKSVHPLKAYVYKNFFTRFSNKPFELNDFYDYEKHFTVMNYTEGVELKHMLCSEFIEKWGEQFIDYNWEEVERDIMYILRECLEAAMEKPPPKGIASSPCSRALYAVDLMLEWDHSMPLQTKIQPKLLEINWTPDCQRACNYYPDFYDKIFGLLFLNETNEIFQEI